jgi:hypothetical protein
MTMKKNSMSSHGSYTIKDLYYDNHMHETKSLIDRYRIKVIESKEQYQPEYRMQHLQFPLLLDDDPISVSYGKVLTIEIKESDFEKLSSNHYEMQSCARALHKIENELNYEATLRSKFPAVAIAYENYQTALALVGYTKEK